eukprot:GHVP01054305.1.p1 GENE.GHVP01054305.1~~GHVP01054305.1.p1  ORF type:complete len:214 (+),score=34.92 GHVP01054305.1:25-666(+)
MEKNSKEVDGLPSPDDEADDAAYFKKIKKTKKKKTFKHVEEAEEILQGDNTIFIPGMKYPYMTLLDRLHDQVAPSLQQAGKCVLRPPILTRLGSRRVIWVNFSAICEQMERPEEHVFQFVLSELGTDGSQGKDGLVLKGRYVAKQIESLIRKYITEYVTCTMCKNRDTKLNRDRQTRLFSVCCDSCGATRNVAPIRSGFHATTKDDRRRNNQR